MWENPETKVSKERRNLRSSRKTNAVIPVPPVSNLSHKQSPGTPAKATCPKGQWRLPCPGPAEQGSQLRTPRTSLGLRVETIFGTGARARLCTARRASSRCPRWGLLGCCFPCCQACCFNWLFSFFFFFFNHKLHF